jgi:broad-specificity NMP kinase
MPYIVRQLRELIDSGKENPVDPGPLNYKITKVIKQYLDDNGLNYSTINDIIGVLECSKLEMYRRLAAGYEDKKIKENGDVY